MTEPLFFDTDCISAFLWVDNESILAKLYPGRIVIPREVYRELSHPGLNAVKELRAQVDSLVSAGQARLVSIHTGSDAYELFRKLTENPDLGHRIIGSGEAACLALARANDGIIASNNLKDISSYVKEYDLKHVTTGDIMKQALEAGLITEAQGNVIWANMLARRRKLGYPTFTDFLHSKTDNSEEKPDTV